MPAKTAPRPHGRPSAEPRPTNTNWWIAALAIVIALVGGIGIGYGVWGTTNSNTFAGNWGSVHIQHAYDAKVVFVNTNNAGCLRPLDGEQKFCTVFAELPGRPHPVKGEIVHAVVMFVTNANGVGYQMATLWASHPPD